MSDDLGFSVACYRGDVPLLRGCLESIRYFAPDAPICLIVHGDFSTRTLEKNYDLQIIRRQDVKDPGLRKWSFGFGLTKLIAFWEAPFEKVFHVDADAVLWGDARKNLPKDSWDFIFNEPHEVITPEIQKGQYFDPENVFNYIEPFPWQNNPYFNAGICCVRRGALDLDEYLRLLELQRKHPEVIYNGDQGMVNIMVFRGLHAGRLRARQAHLQTVVPCVKREDLEARFQITDDVPVVRGEPSIIHWPGAKPWRRARAVFSAPMDYFRGRGMRRCGLPGVVPLGTAMIVDEYLSRDVPKRVLNAKKKVKRLLGRPA